MIFFLGAIHVALASRRVLPLQRIVLRKSYQSQPLGTIVEPSGFSGQNQHIHAVLNVLEFN